MPKPPTFPLIPGLTWETQLYTQRRSNAEPQVNYRFTLLEIWNFFATNGAVFSQGVYVDDAAAEAAGVQDGEYYTVEKNSHTGFGGMVRQLQL